MTRLILVQPDDRTSAALRFGFEREGMTVEQLPDVSALSAGALRAADIVVIGSSDAIAASASLTTARATVEQARAELPLLYVGNGISRARALAAGANEFVGQPAFVRDVVTVARLLIARKPGAPSVLTGELREHFGMFYLVRAVTALRRRGVLTIVRGLRRGELRFFDGEVTSAQVGVLHGLAALHQLLLWTEGRFELRPENVVRRRQIPLDPPELLADAERFLSETRHVADRLSPAAHYERDMARAAEIGKPLPDPIDRVWRLFDGTRTLADIVEDSPYRVFETLQVGNRLAELGLLHEARRAPAGVRSSVTPPIDGWLGGDGPKGRRGKGEDAAAVAATATREAATPSESWARITPQRVADLASPPSVVPATEAAGEISVEPRTADQDTVAGDIEVAAQVPTPHPALPAPPAASAEASIEAATTRPFPRIDRSEARDDDATTTPIRKIEASPSAEPPAVARTQEVPAVEAPAAVVPEPVAATPAPAAASSGDADLDAAPPPVEDEAAGTPTPVTASPPPTPPPAEARAFIKVALEPAPAGPTPSAAPSNRTGRQKKARKEGRRRKRASSQRGRAAAAPAPEKVAQPVQAAPRMVQPPAPTPSAEPAAAAPPIVSSIAPAGAPRPAEPAVVARAIPPPIPTSPPEPSPPRLEASASPRPAGKDQIDHLIRATGQTFTATEEAFFAAGHEIGSAPARGSESFEDLDEGYDVPRTFWQRLMRRPNAPIKRKPS